MYSYHRNPAHKGQKANDARKDLKEYDVQIRVRYVPSNWDDINKVLQRSWKKFRKHQYKEIDYGT